MASTSEPLSLPSRRIQRDPLVEKIPFFYGWVMVPIAVAGSIATCPGQTYGISEFNGAFREDLGLSHTELTGAYMLGTLLAALPVALVGGLMDRYGIRRAMSVVVVLLGATCMATSQVGGIVGLFFAFLMLRMLGQGALSLLSSNTLAMWFHQRLGTAAGVMSLGIAGAFATVPMLNHYLIERVGWRTTYVLLGLAVWAVMLPLLAVFYRDRPEDVGQLPDGEQAPPPSENPSPTAAEQLWNRSLTLRQALRTRAYWMLLSMHLGWAMIGTAVIFNIDPLLESRSLEGASEVYFYPIFALCMAALQFSGGLLADRTPLNRLLCAAMVGMTLSTLQLLTLSAIHSAWLFAILFGCSQGLFMVLGQTVWARYYGRAHLGKIRGTVWTVSVAGSSVGPFVMGVVKDLTGDYTPSIAVFAGIYFLLAIGAVFATPPQVPEG